MIEDREQQVFLTTTGFAVRQAMAELAKRGIATAPLLREAGLPEHDLDQMIQAATRFSIEYRLPDKPNSSTSPPRR